MTTLFISDLHLEDSRPEATGWLRQLLHGPARDAEALYILGDLFEFWIGDDVLSDTARDVARELSALNEAGVKCHFQHGNRDFLIGSDYSRQADLNLLPEHQVIDLYGRPTLLLHGDTLCTDDTEYQAFRRQVRDPAFQALFLDKPPEERLAVARQARDASRQHTGETAMGIMDTNEQAVIDAFRTHGVRHMIHGHTHRPATHRHRIDESSEGERIVLADWYEAGSYLEVGPKGSRSVTLKP
ncbi:UDP-2,3-diacylglucosamine diphosphatase [Elongatibacter sediminis]|uniref:UDP-2,3-diacylglucosamine hydrolase n=1 Tax=Elongatibacter sediminis TaxID=3119006 RepID=A0AAW9RAW4_9GAMM